MVDNCGEWVECNDGQKKETSVRNDVEMVSLFFPNSARERIILIDHLSRTVCAPTILLLLPHVCHIYMSSVVSLLFLI